MIDFINMYLLEYTEGVCTLGVHEDKVHAELEYLQPQ